MDDIGMTYREIKEIVNNMTDEQLSQTAQIMLSQPNKDDTIPLHIILGLDIVHNYVTSPGSDEEQEKTRSPLDNQHYSNQFVFLGDWNLFAEDGTMGFDLETGEKF